MTTTPETATIPDYVHALFVSMYDAGYGRWIRTIMVQDSPMPTTEHMLVPGDEFTPVGYTVMSQREKAPWGITKHNVTWAHIIENDYRLRSSAMMGTQSGPYPGKNDANVWGTYMFRIAFVPVDRDDYLTLRNGDAPSHRTRKIFKDWEAEAAKRFPELASK